MSTRTRAAMDAKIRRPPKNIWDVVLTPLGIAAAYYALIWPILAVRRIGVPSDAFYASYASEGALLLFFLGIGFVALGPGIMLSNVIQWSIPYLRALQDRLNGGDSSSVFRQATRQLRFVSLAIFVLVYPLSILGGLNYFALSPDGISYRPMFSVHVVHYRWQQVKSIETACYTGSKGNPNGQYFLVFDDGRHIDLNAFSARDFFAHYSVISTSLRGVAFSFRFDDQSSTSCPASWLPYFQSPPTISSEAHRSR